MTRNSLLKIFAILSVIWANTSCSLFTDPLAPRLVEEQLVRYIDHPERVMQNITFRLDIPSYADKTAKIKLLFDPAVWGNPVEVQLPMNHAQLSPNSSDIEFVTTFVHNGAIVDYLSRTGNLSEVLRKNATLLLEDNYRGVLKYRRNDGSFGISESSVFLTAFVVKGLQVANRYISINETVLDEALKWLAEQQQPEGQFVEVEPVTYERMKALRLTAYVLAIFASGNTRKDYPEVVNKAVDYVANRTEHMDIYELALSSYALSLVNHTKSSYCLEQLNQPKDTYWRGKSTGAEVAGYALMASLNNDVYTNTEDIVWWLKTRSFNSYGDIQHTVNKVTALIALSQHFERFSKYRNGYIVILEYKSDTHLFGVHSFDTYIYMYEMDLPSDTKLIKAHISGTGFGRLQISYQYERNVSPTEASFALNVELLNTTTAAKLKLQVCVGRLRTNRMDGLTLVEVFLPKGSSKHHHVKDLSPQKNIWKTLSRSEKSLHTKKTSIVVYYQSLGHDMNCFLLSASQFKNARKPDEDQRQQQQMDVIAYDYNNPDRVAWVTYKGFTSQQNSEVDLEAV